jgi:hypothetical protein
MIKGPGASIKAFNIYDEGIFRSNSEWIAQKWFMQILIYYYYLELIDGISTSF